MRSSAIFLLSSSSYRLYLALYNLWHLLRGTGLPRFASFSSLHWWSELRASLLWAASHSFDTSFLHTGVMASVG